MNRPAARFSSDDDGWTEATDIEVDRVDLVSEAANGTSFLLTKAAGARRSRFPANPDPAEEARMTIAKAGKKPAAQLAVFDQNGKLIGTVDPAALQPVQAAPASAKQTPQAPQEMTGDEVNQRAAEVVGNVAKALDGLRPKPASLRKSVTVAPTGAGWTTLLKSLDDGRARRLQATVSAEALKLMMAGVDSKRAVAIAKTAAVRVASARGIV